MATLADNKI